MISSRSSASGPRGGASDRHPDAGAVPTRPRLLRAAARRAAPLSLAGRHGLEARATVSTRAHTHLPVTKRIRHHPVDVLAVSVISQSPCPEGLATKTKLWGGFSKQVISWRHQLPTANTTYSTIKWAVAD